MPSYTRNSAWNNGGTFDNQDLLWYAKGVGAMMARQLDDPSSWWFFAAMHGEYVTPQSLQDPEVFAWKNIPGPPQPPTAPLPDTGISDQYWNQCQHQSWYFPPWHRGYLLALEAQIRADVISLGGPETWALPYWDYLGAGDQYKIPSAFTQQTLPGNGGSNPLLVTARFGPDNDGNIFIPTRDIVKQHRHDPNLALGAVTQDCLSNDLYTGDSDNTKPPGFGGPETGFSFGGDTSGNLENNPHNFVHVYVGGHSPDRRIPGLMSDPGLAALDPIFYLHHANIDRMWTVWNGNPQNANPQASNWLNGPGGNGEREFVIPMPGGKSLVYTPQQMTSLEALDYTYDNLPKPAPAPVPLAERFARLGLQAAAANVGQGTPVTPGGNFELVGANQGAVPIEGTGASTTVTLDSNVRQKVSNSLSLASETAPPDRVFLNLENVRGTRDSYVLSVYINLPSGAKPADHPELLAGSVALFGLRKASYKDGGHGGAGLNFILEITHIVDTLHLNNTLGLDSLHVTIVPNQQVGGEAHITVGRVSVYRQGR
jgi:tyrosinase